MFRRKNTRLWKECRKQDNGRSKHTEIVPCSYFTNNLKADKSLIFSKIEILSTASNFTYREDSLPNRTYITVGYIRRWRDQVKEFMNKTEHKARALGKEEDCIFDNKTISQFTARSRQDVPSMDAFPKLLCSPLHQLYSHLWGFFL